MNSALMLLTLILLLPCAFSLELPRGVPLSKSSFYRIDQPFACFDGSATIAWSQVNDDYCDCQDGSDEPGTAACPNGVFYCRDIQYKLLPIHSAYVNDGFCDCCDGSDEYNGRTTCESTCGILAAAVQQAKSIKRNEIEQGHKIFKEYVEQLKVRKEQQHIADEEAAKHSEEHLTESEVASAPQEMAPASGSDTVSMGSPADDNNGLPQTAGDSSTDLSEDDNQNTTDQIAEAHDDLPPVQPKPEPKPVDYGPEGAFQMLDDMDKCIEFSDLQYTYELCGMREIFQRELAGSSPKISLGKWDEWTYSEDDVLKENKYGVMRFTDGLMCWNGPARSTKVYVHCGPANEIIGVAEPSRCEYVMHLRTAAACFEDPDTIFKRLHPEE